MTKFYITDSGIAFIILSNGCSYSFCKKLESWLVVNARDPITRHGMATTRSLNGRNLVTYPLEKIQNIGHGSQASIARQFAADM